MILPVLLAALALQAAPAASPPPLPDATPAVLPASVRIDLASKISGRTYRVYVAKPFTPAPAGGFPVITVLDGDSTFATAASQVILRTLSGQSGAIVVGVAYPDLLRTMTLRQRDLTPSPPTPGSGDPSASKDPASYGGADLFERFLTEELRPLIADHYRTDPKNQTLVGYSLGGLFALHVLFRHPDAYRTFVAGSPSIWWRDREVLQDEAAFAAKVRSGAVAPRVLITSDGWEQSAQGFDVPAGPQRDAMLKGIAEARMVDNARELADRLKALPGAPGYTVSYALFADETHNSGIPASTSRAVAFALDR